MHDRDKDKQQIIDKAFHAITCEMAFTELTPDKLKDILWNLLNEAENRREKEIKKDQEL